MATSNNKIVPWVLPLHSNNCKNTTERLWEAVAENTSYEASVCIITFEFIQELYKKTMHKYPLGARDIFWCEYNQLEDIWDPNFIIFIEPPDAAEFRYVKDRFPYASLIYRCKPDKHSPESYLDVTKTTPKYWTDFWDSRKHLLC